MLSQSAPTPLTQLTGRLCLRRGSTVCQHSHRSWTSGVKGDYCKCQFGWTLPRTPQRSSGGSVQAGNGLSALAPGLKRFREESEEGRVEAFIYMDGISPGLMAVMANTVRAIFLPRRVRRLPHHGQFTKSWGDPRKDTPQHRRRFRPCKASTSASLKAE